MVGGEDDQRVVCDAQFVQFLEYRPDTVVYLGITGVTLLGAAVGCGSADARCDPCGPKSK